MPLSKLLEPLQAALDECWWYLNGYGSTLIPHSLPAPQPPQDQSPAGWDQWRNENAEWISASAQLDSEYARWIDADASYRVGLPGWYSRYVDVSDHDWAIYFGCEGTTALPRSTLDRIDAFHSKGRDYFGDPQNWSLPNDVVAVLRVVDSAYWDVFFKHPDWRTAIQKHLRRFDSVQCEEFVAPQ
jgi:hypothetical protein